MRHVDDLVLNELKGVHDQMFRMTHPQSERPPEVRHHGALRHFTKILEQDIGFRDVAQKVEALKG